MTQPGAGLDGELEKHDGQWQLRFTRTLPHGPEKVWRALVEPGHLAAWFPFAVEGERRSGAPLRFVMSGAEGEAFDGEMVTFEPPSLLVMRWGDGETLRFQLEPAGAGTLLTFVNTIATVGKGALDAAGWHVCLDALASELDARQPAAATGERWAAVHPGYVARFGPEASTIGPPGAHRG